VIDQIVTLRRTLSTDAKPRLTMSFTKGNNLIYHPLNYMLFNLLYWMFSLSRLQWCFFFHFNVSFHIQTIHFYRCSVILLEPGILSHPGRLKSLSSAQLNELIHNHQIEALNERVTVTKIVTRWTMCQSKMLHSSYPIKLQLTYMKYI
jgi:hypothetical protein